MALAPETRPLVKTPRTDRVQEQTATGPEYPGVLHGERPGVRAPASRLARLLASVLLMAGLGLAAGAPALAADQQGDVRLVARDTNDGDNQGAWCRFSTTASGETSVTTFWGMRDAWVTALEGAVVRQPRGGQIRSDRLVECAAGDPPGSSARARPVTCTKS